MLNQLLIKEKMPLQKASRQPCGIYTQQLEKSMEKVVAVIDSWNGVVLTNNNGIYELPNLAVYSENSSLKFPTSYKTYEPLTDSLRNLMTNMGLKYLGSAKMFTIKGLKDKLNVFYVKAEGELSSENTAVFPDGEYEKFAFCINSWGKNPFETKNYTPITKEIVFKFFDDFEPGIKGFREFCSDDVSIKKLKN